DDIGGRLVGSGGARKGFVPAKERSLRGYAGGVFDNGIIQNIVYSKRVDPNLCDDIQELGDDTPDKMRLSGQAGFVGDGIISFFGFGAALLDARQFDESKG